MGENNPNEDLKGLLIALCIMFYFLAKQLWWLWSGVLVALLIVNYNNGSELWRIMQNVLSRLQI